VALPVAENGAVLSLAGVLLCVYRDNRS
jgi:hypothetical protein